MRTSRMLALVSLVIAPALFAAPTHRADAAARPRGPTGRALRPSDFAGRYGGRFRGVASSGARATLVAWTEREILVSRDGGRSFSPVLREDSLVLSVAVDDHGEVLAVRSARADDGRETSHLSSTSASVTAPASEQPMEVYLAGRFVLVAGRESCPSHDCRTLHLSRDGGRTWVAVPPPHYGNYQHVTRLERDGTVRHLWESTAGCGGGGGGVDRLAPNATAWSELRALVGPDAMEIDARGIASNGRVTLAALEGRLALVVGASWRTLDDHVPAGFELTAVDEHGRALGVLRGRIVRWSQRAGWRVIAE